jgi:23S rRNA (pseudouridine1915-N3)-methyltransferase
MADALVVKLPLINPFKKKSNTLYIGIPSNPMKRLKRYVKFEIEYVQQPKNIKNLSSEQIKKYESEQLMTRITNSDYVILLDEVGKELGSRQFSEFIRKKMNESLRYMVFVIGGAYGCSSFLKERANLILSLSKMTFSHQLVRLIFMEQLYRAFTIIRNEPYHHD